MKKDKKQFEAEIMRLIKKWVPVLFLQQHVFEVKHGTKSENAYLEFNYNYPYLNQVLFYSDKSFKEWVDGKDIEPYVLHEICHCLTDPFYSKAVDRYVGKNEIEDERERLTDLICNIVLKLEL